MDEEKYLYVPVGLLFVTLGENHEQVSFAYPFAYDSKPSVASTGLSYIIFVVISIFIV
ncbi:unnamed protein product [Anisakis simplex]|uniref:Translocon-associated protein subunit alpha n=1 Tax=Anisakis simplex TaxID=6269 RepID=A0A0M3JNY0_ANISI|nr:unnamed protein product [Anisakis simplex]